MRTACTLWGLLYLLFVARIFATPTRLGVYPIFALAARRWWEGVGMYVPADGLEMFRYSPTFSVGFAPFGLLPVLGSGAAERALLPFLPFSPAIQPAGVVVFLFWLSLWNWRFPPLET